MIKKHFDMEEGHIVENQKCYLEDFLEKVMFKVVKYTYIKT